MPKYDAFGREIGEDTLSGLGGGSAERQAAPAQQDEPVAWPAPEQADPAARSAPEQAEPAARSAPEQAEPAARSAPEQPTPAPSGADARRPDPAPRVTFEAPSIPGVRRRRRTGGLGCLIGLVVLAAVVAGPLIAIVSFVGQADEAIDSVRGALDDAVPALPESGPPPRGLSGASMVAADNFGAALRTLRGENLRSLAYIRVEPERLDTQGVTRGRLRNVQIRYDGEVSAPPATSGTAASTFRLAAVDPAAPARLVRAAAKRARLPVRRIDYLVSADAPGGHHWLAYFENGPFAEGDRRGRLLRLTPR